MILVTGLMMFVIVTGCLLRTVCPVPTQALNRLGSKSNQEYQVFGILLTIQYRIRVKSQTTAAAAIIITIIIPRRRQLPVEKVLALRRPVKTAIALRSVKVIRKHQA